MALAGCALAAVLLSSYGMYRLARRNLNAELDQRIMLAAEEGARAVTESLRTDDLSVSREALQRRLESIRRTSQLENLFVFDPDRRSLADARPRVPSGKLYTYLQLPPEVGAVLWKGETFLDHGRSTESLVFRSAAVPLRVDGQVQGGVYAQASVDFEEGLEALRKRWFTATVCSVGACLLLVSVLVWLFHRNRRMHEAVQRRSRLELVHRLSAGIAHDVKNPLAGMLIAAEKLEQEVRGHPRAIEQVGRIREGSERIREVVDNLVGTGKGMERRRIDLQVVLGEIIGPLLPVAAAKGARIENTLTDSLEVTAPPTPLRMAMVNVLHNAIEAVPEEAGRVHIGCRRGRGVVGLAISDNGPGIPRPLRRKIFDPLVTTKQEGSGLGLPVARQLVEDMKGSIEVESVAGAGTTFVVWLPANEEAADS